MQPYPAPNSVIVLDNCSIHKHDSIKQLVKERCACFLMSMNVLANYNASGCRMVFLPPYSPDYNPIEESFSNFKAKIRRNGKLVREMMEAGDKKAIRALCDLYFGITANDAAGWFLDSGY